MQQSSEQLVQRRKIRFVKIQYKCNFLALITVLSIYFSLIINFPFIIKSYNFLSHEATLLSVIVLFTIPFFLFFIFFSLFSILSIKYLEKPIFIVFTLLSAILSYSNFYYGLVFDDYSPMIGVIEQTNFKEVAPFITPSFLGYFLLFGIIPAYLIYKIKITHFSLMRECLIKLAGVTVYPLFYFAIFLPLLPIYHPMLRLSGLAGRLPFQIIPTNFFENFYNHYRLKLNAYVPYRKIGTDAKDNMPSHGKHNLLVMVIGETARSMNFSLNTYNRDTNFYTKKQNVLSFKHFKSCGTATRVSVPCIFSALSRKHFFNMIADKQDNLLDILKYAGLNILWIDNNGAGDCQGVCKHVDLKIVHEMDDNLIDQLKNAIDKLNKKDTMIVLHLNGSHGPAYYEKYPDAFRKFLPDCRKNELRFCTAETLTNAYDNSILYTDFVLSKMIEILKSQDKKWNTAFIYTSDHGESIGEHGMYGHCAPYLIAPKEQTHVPFIIWLSDDFSKNRRLSLNCLKTEANNINFSHDNIFHSVLGLMQIETTAYHGKLDLFKPCYNFSK